MDPDIRTSQLIRQVVAWHNRHPLARRITPAQVSAVGVVALPFVVPADEAPAPPAPPDPNASAVAEEARLAEAEAELAAALADTPVSLLAARPSPSAPVASASESAEVAASAEPEAGSAPVSTRGVPVFSERFAPPLTAKAVARWARPRAVTRRTAAGPGPVREVPVDPALRRIALQRLPQGVVVHRYLASAAFESGARRLRCLIAPGAAGAAPVFLGPRLWDSRRVAALALLLLLMAGLGAWLRWRGADPIAAPEPPPQAVAAGPTSSEPAAAPLASSSVTGPVLAPASGAGPVDVAASATPGPPVAAVAGPAPPASVPDVAPERASEPLIGRLTEEERRAVRELSETLREAWAASAAERAERRRRANSPEGRPVAGVTTGQPVYALVGPVFADKALAEAALARLRSGTALMSYPASMRFELLGQEGQWRAAWFPFVERATAERNQAMLARRGVRVELVEF